MQLLHDRIRRDGIVLDGGILKVGSFLNQQLDVGLLNEIGREFARRFAGAKVDRILTIEASGIAVACIAAQYFSVPVVFAKKHASTNLSNDTFQATVHSFTHGADYDVRVAREFLPEGESVLIIDDFLANGCALEGLVSIVRQAGSQVAGAGIVIEKGFQDGGERLRRGGLRIESLALIERMSATEGIVFR